MHPRGDSDQHVLTLFAIALACKGKTYIELGVKNGKTTAPLLAAAVLNGGQLISVDIRDTPFRAGGAPAGHWQFVKSDVLLFLDQWSGPMDFVFIDDWHSYAHVKVELELIANYVSPLSVILLHDTMYYNYQPYYHSEPDLPRDDQWGEGGPYRAVAELDPVKWEWATLPWGHGLTLLRRKV